MCSSAQPVNDEQLAKHLSKDRERELLWQQELAQRSAQLIREKQLAEERRQERELERNEWEARLKSQEEVWHVCSPGERRAIEAKVWGGRA